MHLIRHALEFVSWKDRKLVVPTFKAIYRAKNAEADLKPVAEFETSFWGQRYPAIAQSWQRNWEHVMPFFAYPESVRRIIYTTDEIDKSFLLRASAPAIDAIRRTALKYRPRVRNKPPSTRRRRPSPDHNRHTAHYSHSAHLPAASFNPASMRSRSRSPLNGYTAPRRPSRFRYGASASIDPPRTGNGSGCMPALRNLTLPR